MPETLFRQSLLFFDKIGVYDVVLPFLLIFTIIFAVLEKTKLFGTDTINGHAYTKKNLNAIVAFVVAFLVVASAQLVAIINETMAHIVLLLLVSISFLLLIGTFYKEGELIGLEGRWRTFFMFFMFIGVVLIFMNAIRLRNGQRLLEFVYQYLTANWTSNFTASVILVIVLVLFILYITKEPGGAKKEEHGTSGGHH